MPSFQLQPLDFVILAINPLQEEPLHAASLLNAIGIIVVLTQHKVFLRFGCWQIKSKQRVYQVMGGNW